MTGTEYEKLADALSLRGGAMPALKCREFFALLEELFTLEEAELASKMPILPFTAETFAREIVGGAPKKVESLLEGMADKGLVITIERDGVRHYTLMPLVPGIFEMQFMKGEVSERARKLARLFDDYFAVVNEAARKTLAASSTDRAGFPFARVISVEEEIPPEVAVYSYDMVSDYIAKAEYIAVSICYCRHHGELLGRPCDKPKDVCMSFGPQAKFAIERGFGKQVSKEEALKILERSEEAGLVHCSSNTGKYIGFICNCCICHCGILQSMKHGIMPMGAVSSFLITVKDEDCTGCGACVERCQMDALSMDGDIVVRHIERCIGCGLCISICPTEALKLVRREIAPVPPSTQRELNTAMMSSSLQQMK